MTGDRVSRGLMRLMVAVSVRVEIPAPVNAGTGMTERSFNPVSATAVGTPSVCFIPLRAKAVGMTSNPPFDPFEPVEELTGIGT